MKLSDEQLADIAERIVDRQPKCHVCDGSGVVHVGTFLNRKTCSTCEGTGFFALSADAMRSIVLDLVETRTKLLTDQSAVVEHIANAARAVEADIKVDSRAWVRLDDGTETTLSDWIRRQGAAARAKKGQ